MRASVLMLVCGLAAGARAGDWVPILPKALSRHGRRAEADHAAIGRGFRQQNQRNLQQQRRGREQAPAVQGSYGAPPAEDGPTPIDLHNKEFCVDVSTYEPVMWVEKDAEECDTVFVKECEEKSEKVCQDVTETSCQVVPYTVCEMGLEPQESSSSMLAPKLFVEKTCTQGQKEIPHTKLLPECHNVTKQNCVTLWETDADGKQVWAGTDACEPVTWQECKLVPKDVKFIVPEITCVPAQELWYHEPEPVTETRMTNTYGCVVESTTDCTTNTRPDCKTVKWEECREVPVTNCQPKSIHIPTQEKLHRKKCLLPDDGQDAAPPSYGAPPPPPPSVPTYSAPQPTYTGRRS